MKFIFLMDPLETVNVRKDTSLTFMSAAHNASHEVFFLPEGGITKLCEEIIFDAIKVIPKPLETFPFEVLGHETLSGNDVDAVFIRTDPPFDEKYLMQTWLLDLLPKHIPVINSPKGIRTVNEKVWAAQFTSIIPETVISQNAIRLNDFISKHGLVIAKPTNSFGGQSIFKIKKNDANLKVILETLTAGFTTEIILQKYVAEAENGDKRILLLNGEPLGAVLRVHSKDDHRNNFFAGGKPKKAEITKNDLRIIKTLKPHLLKLGLYFVGIDIIGDYLIEVNVTSPTCVVEINQLNNIVLQDKVIKFVEILVDQFRNTDKIHS